VVGRDLDKLDHPDVGRLLGLDHPVISTGSTTR
jgi:hypothetical protein